MPDELPAPVVTITDPNHPGAVGDVIGSGSEREPWKPSRAVVRRGLLALVVLVAVAAPVTVVKVRDSHRRLDAQAVAELTLTDGGNEGGEVDDDGVVPFTLYNGGKHPVRLLSAHIDREGYPTQKLDVTIDAGSTGRLSIALPSPCPQQVSRFSQPRLLVLRVRTHRGTVVTKSVRLGDDFGFTYQESLRTSCGFLDPSEALEGTVLRTVAGPKSLELLVSVTNKGREAYDVRTLLALPGLTARVAELPVHLPTRPGAVDLPVTFTVSSCTQARQTTKTDPTSDYVAPGLALVTKAGVAEVFFDPDVQTAITQLVARSCP